MQFLVTARDNPDALEKRKAARDQHLALGDQMIAAGNLLFAAAMLDEKRDMNGSMMVLEFANREALNKWLTEEPYVTAGVWGDVEVRECIVGPSFSK